MGRGSRVALGFLGSKHRAPYLPAFLMTDGEEGVIAIVAITATVIVTECQVPYQRYFI